MKENTQDKNTSRVKNILDQNLHETLTLYYDTVKWHGLNERNTKNLISLQKIQKTFYMFQ